jgi:hypothetical protein
MQISLFLHGKIYRIFISKFPITWCPNFDVFHVKTSICFTYVCYFRTTRSLFVQL